MLSDAFFRKLNWAFGLMALGVLFGLIAFSTTVEIKDLDLWLHIRTGQFIVEHGFVPSVDVLSCSFAGHPWVNHEWLFQVIVYLVQHAFGMDGLIYMQTVVVMATFLVFLLLTYHRDRQLLIAPLFYLVLLVYQTRFTIRPDIFSLLFFALFIYVLSLHLSKRWSLWVLFILQILWTNMHGYSMFGIVFVLIALASELAKRHLRLPYKWNEEGRLLDEEYDRLKWILLFVVLAMFINPLTFKGAWYPVSVLLGMSGDSHIFFKHITELSPSIAWATVTDMTEQGPYKALILVSFLSFVFNRKNIDVSAFFCWLVFLLFSLSAVRNMVYFAFAAYVVSLHNLSAVALYDVVPIRFVNEKMLQTTGWIISLVMIVFLLNYGQDISLYGYYDFDRYERKSEFLGVTQRNFPDKAADFLTSSGIQGNFFNDFNSGAYLIGRVYPRIRVYMDGRTELRGGEFFMNYRKIWDEGDEKLFDEAVQKYHLTGALINTARSPAPEPLLKMIGKKKEWKPVYFDYDAIIFLKDDPENEVWIERFGIDLSEWHPRDLDLFKLGSARVLPYRNVSRAYTLMALGFDDQALAEAEAALAVSPSYAQAYRIRGDVEMRRKDFEKAFEDYRLAAVYADGHVEYKTKMLDAALGLGRDQYVLDEVEKLLKENPENNQSRLVFAKALLKKGQYQRGYDILVQVFSKDAHVSDDVLELGDVCREAGERDWALRIYALVTASDGKNAAAYERVGDIYYDQGNRDMALRMWEKSLTRDANNEELQRKIGKVRAETP